MNSSQTSVQLRQRGVAIAGGGLLLQLLGVAIAAGGTSIGGYGFVPLLVAAGACALSFTKVKDHTGVANVAAVLTVLITLAGAFAASDWGGLIPAALGAVALYIGNKQLAAGIRSN